MSSSKKVLSDHKRNKKVFIPPLLQLPNMRLDDWRDERLPEFLWIGHIQKKLGVLRANYLLMTFSKVVAQVHDELKTTPNIWCAPTTSFERLPETVKEGLVSGLEKNKILEEISYGLSDLFICYPEIPLKFLDTNRDFLIAGADDVKAVKKTIESMYNRHDKSSVLAIATALQMAGDKVQFTSLELMEGMNECFQHLNEVIDKRLAEVHPRFTVKMTSFLGAFYAMYKHGLEKPLIWPKYFWDRGFQLTECKQYG